MLMVIKMLEKQKIKNKLNVPISVKFFHKIDSTNIYLKRNIKNIKTDCLVVAKKQSNGQGRLGKSFYSCHGAYFSLLLNNIDNYDITLLTIKVGIAINRVLKQIFNIDAKIKWVNDLYYNGYKFCGILCEKIENSLIIGIGINLNSTKFPEKIKDIAISIPLDKKDYCLLISSIINEIYLILKESNSNVIKEYTNNLILLNKEIAFSLNNINYTGIVKGVNNQGNLIVATAKETIVLKSGEVSLTSKHII